LTADRTVQCARLALCRAAVPGQVRERRGPAGLLIADLPPFLLGDKNAGPSFAFSLVIFPQEGTSCSVSLHRRLFYIGGCRIDKVGARCVSSARRDQCGGLRASSVATATVVGRAVTQRQGTLDIELVATHLDNLGGAQSASIDCGCSVGTGSQLWLYIGRFSPQLA
jgi:hypothetical protein